MRPGMVVLDLETTGLDPERHSVIEYAAIDWTGDWISCSHRIRPGREIDPKALNVNGASVGSIDVREVGYFQAIEDLFAWLQERADIHGHQLILAGMNVHFDARFLVPEWKFLYRNNNYRCPWSHRVYDLHTLALAYLDLFDDEIPDRLHSDALARALKLEPEETPHTALRGAEWACRAFDKIHSNLLKMKGVSA